MKLSVIISDYRKQAQISQREFARRCGLSNSYISFIENEYNPRTGKPIVPTLEQYRKIATGMGLTVHQLFEQLDDDSPVDLLSFEAEKAPLVIPDTESFKQIVSYMSQEDYLSMMQIFERTYEKMKKLGVEVK